jgi:hypothetical protein
MALAMEVILKGEPTPAYTRKRMINQMINIYRNIRGNTFSTNWSRKVLP